MISLISLVEFAARRGSDELMEDIFIGMETIDGVVEMIQCD